MVRASWFGSIVVALLLVIANSHSPVGGQTIDSSLQSIRTAIVQATGIPEAAINLRAAAKILLVSRVNSALNQTDHSARDGEASRIATAVAKTISNDVAYKNVHTIRVQYVATMKPGGHEKIIDTIDFRRDPSGAFRFHAT